MSLSKWTLHFIIIAFVLTGCSTKNKEEVSSSAAQDSAAEDKTLDMLDEFEGEDLFAMDEQALDDELMSEGQEDLVFSDDQLSSEQMAQEEAAVRDQMMDESWEESTAPSSAPQIQESASYTVQEGDTLMYVAHKKYGDYSKWRSLAQMNGMSGAHAQLEKGMTLQLDPSQIQQLPELTGRAYVIKRGDTLSKISRREYGTIDRWKDLWRHNSVMIKDPDLIFAGFQMHLLPDGTVAFNL